MPPSSVPELCDRGWLLYRASAVNARSNARPGGGQPHRTTDGSVGCGGPSSSAIPCAPTAARHQPQSWITSRRIVESRASSGTSPTGKVCAARATAARRFEKHCWPKGRAALPRSPVATLSIWRQAMLCAYSIGTSRRETTARARCAVPAPCRLPLRRAGSVAAVLVRAAATITVEISGHRGKQKSTCRHRNAPAGKFFRARNWFRGYPQTPPVLR
jgi:hypothetical protein